MWSFVYVIRGIRSNAWNNCIDEILLFNMRRGIKGQVFQQDKPGLELHWLLQGRLREALPSMFLPREEVIKDPQSQRWSPLWAMLLTSRERRGLAGGAKRFHLPWGQSPQLPVEQPDTKAIYEASYEGRKVSVSTGFCIDKYRRWTKYCVLIESFQSSSPWYN